VIRVTITARAERDLEDIWLIIAANNPRAATRIVHAIGKKIALLAEFPRFGTSRPDIRPAMRLLIQRPYLVLYEVHTDENDLTVDAVEVVRIVDGRRDLRRLF
jgi:toxin ParE1/3/4